MPAAIKVKEYKITVRLLEADYQALREAAERLDLPMSQVLRMLIRESKNWRQPTDAFGNPLINPPTRR